MLAQESKIVQLPLKKIRLDERVNMRQETSWVAVQEYAEAIEDGDQFPPAVVFFDGVSYWLADGFHRIKAALKAKLKTFPCEVRTGTRRDAMIHSAGCNGRHGVRRTNADKRRAVVAFLSDKEWKKWNSAEIARRCAVSAKLVEIIRERMNGPASENEFRLQFNGRGEIQYRRGTTKSAPEAPMDYGACPYCGQKMHGPPMKPGKN